MLSIFSLYNFMWINYKNNIRRMCFFVDAYFCEMPTSRIVQISGNLTVKFMKKDQLPKNIFDRAHVFSAVRNSMCKCRCGWEKSVGKIRHEDFYLEDAAERKTSVAYLSSCERCRRHLKNENAS